MSFTFGRTAAIAAFVSVLYCASPAMAMGELNMDELNKELDSAMNSIDNFCFGETKKSKKPSAKPAEQHQSHLFFSKQVSKNQQFSPKPSLQFDGVGTFIEGDRRPEKIFPSFHKYRRIDLRKFGQQSGIELFFGDLEHESRAFFDNLSLSTLIFAGKTKKSCKKFIERFDREKYHFQGNLKYVQRICKTMPITLNSKKFNAPTMISTEVLSKFSGPGQWCLTPLDKDGKMISPKNLLNLVFYSINNYRDITNKGTVAVYPLLSAKNIIDILETMDFKKKDDVKLANRSCYVLSRNKFLKICNNPKLPLEY